ncbi:hypothetical protein [Enterococcus faecium]|nr:hypothetical protein [Enterococcus faecium]
MEEVALAIKTSFQYTSEWLPTAYQIERQTILSQAQYENFE